MKKFVLLLFLILFSCEDEKDSRADYMLSSTEIHFKAYKYIRRVSVRGQFDNYKFSGIRKGKTFSEIFKNARAEIFVSSVNTRLSFRDQKIREYFFRILKSSDIIYAQVRSVNEEKKSGILSFTMNGIISEIPFRFLKEKNKFKLIGTIDLEAHHAQPAIDSLNKACGKHHIGKDGIEKMWPDIDFEIIAEQ